LPDADDFAALMADVAAGERRAFDRLMYRALPRAYRLALRLLGNVTEAEELAQEAMLRVWRHAGGFDPGRARFEAWLGRIVTNLAFDRLRTRKRSGKTVPLEDAASVPDAGESAEDKLVRAGQHALVALALAGLPERQRAAVVLVHYEGLSGAEAAAALGATPKAVEGLLTRAMENLRRAMPSREEERVT
jgi:RNA polymerase sigma-70 factor (ECF subfamily)